MARRYSSRYRHRRAGLGITIHLGGYAHESVPGVVNLILCWIYRLITYFRQFCWYFVRSADGSGYIVTAIDVIYEDIVRGVFTVKVYERRTADISHAGTGKNSMQVAGIDIYL